MFSSFIVYNITLLLSLLAVYLKKEKKIFYFLALFTLTLISVLRYDIGWDYSGFVEYYYITLGNSYSIFFKEPAFFFLCKIFSIFERGYIFVFAFYFVVGLIFLLKALKYYNIPKEGIFIFISLGYLFITFDQIRQCLSIFIFLYSFKYIEEKKFFIYLLLIFLAANAHFSAVILLPFYWILQPKINRWVMLAAILVMIVLYYTNFWIGIREKLFSIIPYYKKYAERSDYLLSTEASTGIGVIFYILISTFIVIYKKLVNNDLIVNSVFYGLLIFLFACGNLNIYRVSIYFSFAIILALPLIMKRTSDKLIKPGIIIVGLLYFQGMILTNQAGCNPYRTVFSKNAKQGILMQDTSMDLK